ncbi:uncharacterized protein [Dendrobates tinctorius]|uniref:uncharacterized protein isoform X3 n=1 Tax=Dendrobates tinctorius TaxID=92724 RepID=UPI003CC9371B
MQNNSSGKQTSTLQAGSNQDPDSTVKPKFKCKDCNFHCSSLQNFRIHLQMSHQTTNETIEKLSALKKAVEEIKKVQPVRNFQPEIKNVNPAGNVQQGAVKTTPTISKPFVPHAQAVRNVNPAGNVQPAQAVRNVNPAGNVQPGAVQKPTTISKPFIPYALAVRNVNPAGNVQPGAVQMPTPIRKPFVPNVRNMNPARNIQPAGERYYPFYFSRFSVFAGWTPFSSVLSWVLVKPAIGAVQMATPIRKPFVPNVQGIMVMNPAGNVRPGAVKMTPNIRQPFIPNVRNVNPAGNVQPAVRNMYPAGNVQPVQENQKGKPAWNIQPAQEKKLNPPQNTQPVQEKQKGKPAWVQPGQEKQKAKPAGNVQLEVIPESCGRIIAKLKDYMSRRDREPLIGLEYVLEYNTKTITNQIEPKYFCELCECDLELDPMVEHLAGFGHRKLYLAKEYPYVLKAQSSSKEDPSKFIRRMALEIEREEGTKMYLVDSSIWPDTMMTLRTADRRMRKKSRWSDEKNDETRMKKALAYLESFEIDSEIEATTVTRLCEKLTANLKFYSTNAMQVALFPSRVAKAQDVAMSLVKNVANQRSRMHNANQMNSQSNMPSKKKKKKSKSSPLGNPNLETIGERQSSFPGNNSTVQNMPLPPPYQQAPQNTFNPSINAKPNLLGPPVYQQAPQNAFVPPMNANQNMPSAQPYQLAWKKTFVPLNSNQAVPGGFTPKENETPQKADSSSVKNTSEDDAQFFKKLVSLLEAIPQNSPVSESTQPNSKLQMLKSLLLSKKNEEQEQANQKMMTQIASLVKDTITAQSANLNQQLMMLMATQKNAMVMQTASLNNSLMAPMPLNNSVMNTSGLVSGGVQNVGNMPMNMNPMMPYQNFGTQVYGQMGEMAPKSMNPNAYQVPPPEMQNYPSTSQTINSQPTSHSLNYGYGNSMGDSYTSQHGGIANSITAVQSEQTCIPYTNVGDKPSVYDKQWDNSYGNSSQVVDPKYGGLKKKPYSSIDLPPSSSQTQHNDYYNTRGELGREESRPQKSLRSYNSPGWDDQEGDIPYIKRARLEDHTNEESLNSLGINTAGMPEELLKRIRGKDLFTVSAILSEYSERHSGK